MGTWWSLYVLLGIILVLGRPAVVVTLAIISLLGLWEALGLTRSRRFFPLTAGLALGVYLWAWLDWEILFLGVMPALGALLLLAELAWRAGILSRYVETRGVALAFLAAVAGPCFTVAVASLPPPAELPDERLGWLLLLFFLTELNDMAQSWWGRPFGATQLAPSLSPAKSWEGLVGGLATTVPAAVLLAPMITGYGRGTPPAVQATGPPWIWAAGIGLLVGATGLLGDLALSALKRRAAVKDAGRLLPGHGGILDRFDSLALTAPVYFWATYLLWMPWP